MHPTQRALPRVKRNAALQQFWIQSVLFKFLLAPSACKEPSVIALALETNLEDTCQLGLMKSHKEAVMPSAGTVDFRSMEVTRSAYAQKDASLVASANLRLSGAEPNVGHIANTTRLTG